MKIGYFLSSEEYTPAELIEQARAAERGRLRGAVDLRPLPPVERRAGSEPVRLVDDRRARAGLPAAGDDRGDLPDGADPPGGHRPGRGHQRGAARRPVRPRGRQRRGAQRAHPRRRAGRTADVRLEMLEEAVEVMRKLWTGRVRQPPRQALHRRERPDLHPARDPPPVYVSGVRPEGGRRSPAGSATATSPRCPTRSWSHAFREAGGGGKPPRPASRRAGRDDRGRGRSDRATGCGRTPGCRASCPRCCRRRGTSSRPASWSRRRR